MPNSPRSSIANQLLLQPASSQPLRIPARVAAEVPTGTNLAGAKPLWDVSPRARLATFSLRAVSPRTEPPTPSRRLSGPTPPSLVPTLVKNYLRNHISKDHVTKTIQRKSLLPYCQSTNSQSSPRTLTPAPTRSGVYIPKPLPDIPVGGQLSLFAKKWGEVCEDSHALEAVRHGVSLSFQDRPPLLPEPVFSVRSDKRHEEILFHVEEMLRVCSSSVSWLLQHMFLVPKKNGEMRTIINLKSLNNAVEKGKFKMETQRAIRRALQQGDWVTSIGLKDANFHIPIKPAFRKFLRFTVGKEVFQFKALPFGLTSAPERHQSPLVPRRLATPSQVLRGMPSTDTGSGPGDDGSQIHCQHAEVRPGTDSEVLLPGRGLRLGGRTGATYS